MYKITYKLSQKCIWDLVKKILQSITPGPAIILLLMRMKVYEKKTLQMPST